MTSCSIARSLTAIENCKLKILNLWYSRRSYIVLKIRANLSSLGKKYDRAAFVCLFLTLGMMPLAVILNVLRLIRLRKTMLF